MAYGTKPSTNGNGTHRLGEFALKEQMCDIGRRIWQKGFCAGNEGNHSYRIADNKILCTPTGISKGFLRPDDICTGDLRANSFPASASARARSCCTWPSTRRGRT